MKLKTLHILEWVFWVLGLVPVFVIRILDLDRSHPAVWVSLAMVVIALVAMTVLRLKYCRCPHCGARLDNSRAETCPGCGNPICPK